MSDTSSWSSIGGGRSGRMFGIYREPDPDRCGRRAAGINCKILTLLGVLASSALAIFFVSLFLTNSGLPELAEELQFNNSDDDSTSNVTILQPINATAPVDGVTDTLSRPIGSDYPTEVYPQTADTQEERSVFLEATTGSHGRSEPRRVRAYVEDVVKARIINRKRLSVDQVGASYSQLPSYGDEYAQLEGYRNPPRGIQDVMSWVDKPGLKFTGVYFKSEDKPYLNGHAYVSDPFVRFKPSHPSEINQLAIEPDRGPRFSNRPDPQSSSSHTQAIFHPTMRPRPLKIMLDIYPMIPETLSSATYPEYAEQPRGKRPRLPPEPSSNRMIVHLNLYPKKSSRLNRRRPTLGEEGAQQRMYEESDEKDHEASTATTTEDYEISYESSTEQTENK